MHRSHEAHNLRPPGLTPTPRIGILGGGQLAKLTAIAASQFGCEVVVLERQEDFPAHSLDTHALVGDWNDPNQVLELASLVDVVTLENEFVSINALAAIADKGYPLWPRAETIALVQDKLRQKRTFADAGLPVPRFANVPNPEALREFGFPAVLKKRRNSYDGKGNATIRSESDIPAAWSKLGGTHEAIYAEEFCTFAMELALIVTRGQDGAIASYPVVETINREHICHIVKAPAEIPAAVAATATDIGIRAVESISGVGSFGIELFYSSDGRVLMNEIAPRVHNTGHYTIEACLCSQFENHIRAVLGWPLGPTNMVTPAACMVNLLGYGEGSGVPLGLRDAMSIPGAHVHVYGKSRSVRGRKMGHVVTLGQTTEEASARAQRAADCIRFGGEQ